MPKIILATSRFEGQFMISKEQWPVVDKFYDHIGWPEVDRSMTGTNADKKAGIDAIVKPKHLQGSYSGETLQEKGHSYKYALNYCSMTIGVDEIWRISPAYLSAVYYNEEMTKVIAGMVCNFPAFREYVAKTIDFNDTQYIHKHYNFLWIPFSKLILDDEARGAIARGPFFWDKKVKDRHAFRGSLKGKELV